MRKWPVFDGQRTELPGILRQRKVAAFVVYRTNALPMPDDGRNAQSVPEIPYPYPYPDPDTVRDWLREFRRTDLILTGISAYSGREGRLNRDRETAPRVMFWNGPPRDRQGLRYRPQPLRCQVVL